MNIDRLYAKYCIHKNNSPDSLIIDKAGFTQAIAEIISNPVEAVVKPANGGLNLDDNLFEELRKNFIAYEWFANVTNPFPNKEEAERRKRVILDMLSRLSV